MANHDGNVSARLGPDRFLVTPTATSKADVSEGHLAVADARGKVAEGEARPPSEFALHLGAFAERPDIGAVIHAHPPYATAMACAGRGLSTFLAEAVVSIGPEVPVADFALPFGAAGAAPIRALIGQYDALLLSQHGVLTVAATVDLALLRMELVEHMARIWTLAQPLGGVRPLPQEVLGPLIEKRRKAKLGLAAERTALPGEGPSNPAVPSPPAEERPSALVLGETWTPAGPPPARDAWSGGKAEGSCGLVYGAGEGTGSGRDAEELKQAVDAAVSQFLGKG